MHECKIAEKLVELRNLKGVTQEDVAQSLSISNKTVSKWENGVSAPDLVMLAELSKYYGVTTDTLLGLTDEKNKTTREEVCAAFKGLDRKEAVLKAFDAATAVIPAIYNTVSKHYDNVYDGEEVFPAKKSHFYRNNIALHEFFNFVATSENVNISVMMLRNKSNFAWMNDKSKQEKIVKLFRLLSNEDALSIIYFIHSTSCSESFTSDYIAKNTGIDESRVKEILDETCNLGICSCVTAHLAEGEVSVYECFGDGIILSLITLAFEKTCGKESYDYNFSGRCKMIRGE